MEQDRTRAYADWLIANKDRAGSPEYVKVADAYRKLREGAAPAPAGPGFGSGPANALSATASGFNKTLGTMLGGVPDLINWPLRAAGVPGFERTFGERIQGGMEKAGMIRPTGGYEGFEEFGSNLAPGVALAPVAGLATAAGAASGSPIVSTILNALGMGRTATGTVAREAVGAGLQMAGGAAGRAAGGAVGGEAGARIGDLLGSLAGPMAPAAVTKGIVEPAARRMLGRADGSSGQAYDTLVQSGVTPTPGLVGNSAVARMENAATYVPGFPSGERVRTQSFQDFQRALFGAADDISGSPIPTREVPDRPVVGARFQDVAREGLDNARARLGAPFQQIEDTFGPRRGVDITRTLETDIPAMQAQTSGGRQGTLASAMDDIMGTRGIEIRDSQNELGPRTVMPFEQARDTVSDVKSGMVRGGVPTLSDRYTGGLAQSLDDRIVAALRSEDPALADSYTTASRAYADAHNPHIPLTEGGDVPYLDKLSSMKTGQDAFTNVMSEGQWERADVLRRNNPGAWPAVASDILTTGAEAPVRNQTADISVSPMVFTTWWKGLAPEARMRLAQNDPAMLDRLQNLADSGQLFLDRAGSMNFSNTAPSAATATFMGSILSNPLLALKVLGSSAATGALATSPNTARAIAGRTRPAVDALADPALRASAREWIGGL